jgi:hypothetical protein
VDLLREEDSTLTTTNTLTSKKPEGRKARDNPLQYHPQMRRTTTIVLSFLVASEALVSQPPALGRSSVKERLRDYLQVPEADSNQAPTTTALDDAVVGRLLKELQSTPERANHRSFDPQRVAGTWRVIHAPHLAALSKVVQATLSPIEYHLTKEGQMAASVQYVVPMAKLEGWLCTSGYYDYTVEATTPGTTVVQIVWNRAWWNADRRARPTPPEEGLFPASIQRLGMLGFRKSLSFFPVDYVDEEIAIFRFLGLHITAMKQPADPQPAIFVARTDLSA